MAYNRTRGKDTDTGEYISSINPDTVTSKLNSGGAQRFLRGLDRHIC
jgi:hemoglobin/transferrin/lactoferrin receptor protein